MTTTLERFAMRRGTAAAWTAANPVLADGEEGWEKDTRRRKIGDGTTHYNALPYDPAATEIAAAVSDQHATDLDTFDRLLTATTQKTGNYTANPNEFVPFDATAALRTLTLPNAPADGTRIGARIDAGGSGVTLARAGSDVFTGGGTSFSMTLLGENVIVKYRASDHTWVIIEHGYAKSSLLTAVLPTDQGLCAWSSNLPAGATGSAALTSQKRYYVRLKCTDVRTLSVLYVGVASAGAGLTSGQNLIGLVNSAGTLIGTCPDQTTPWASTGIKIAALTVVGGQSLAVTPGQIVYAQFLSVGTTPPSLSKANTTLDWGNVNIGSAPFRFNTGATGQTALATSTTMTGLTADFNSWAVALA